MLKNTDYFKGGVRVRVRVRNLVLRLSNPDFDADSEFAISFDGQTSMTVINVEIRAENLTFSVFRIFCTPKFFPKKSANAVR
jgi:hypothetical protein